MTVAKKVHVILYINDQGESGDFYSRLLQRAPVLNVPGMTEFELTETCKLGLMPNAGIKKILEESMPDPALGNGIPRCELYLFVNDVTASYKNALACGAREVSPPANRDWGDAVAYVADPDGHIIAFASNMQ